MPSRGRLSASFCFLSTVFAALLAGPVPGQGAFEAELAHHEQLKKRPSLNRRLEGTRLLAGTGDPRAFDVVRKEYASPIEPVDFVRSVLVTQFADLYRGEQPRDTWRKWREAYPQAEHLWLWYRALQLEGAVADGSWRDVFAQRLPIELRVATLAAAGNAPEGLQLDKDTLALAMETAAALPHASRERAMLLEGLIGLFEARDKEQKGTPFEGQARTVLHSMLHLMAERDTTLRTRIVLARSIARALQRDDIGPDPAGWIDLLSDKPREQIEIAYAERRAKVPAGFFGIPEHGRTIAYVIDASDSMLTPLTPRELADLQPRTGAGASKPADGAKGPARADAAERAVDWSKVKNRFDASRELLELALRRLQPDQRFTVILFGSKAGYLAATEGLVPATKANIDKVCAEIDAIKSRPSRNPDRPYGELRGSTNLHGGMLLAFRAGEARKSRATPSKPKAKPGTIEPEPDWVPFDERGVDTVYLLSDGAPSADNWDGADTNDGTTVGDPETRGVKEYSGPVIYYGPFSQPPYLVPELQRLNLLQRASIHAIGLGEADFELLERIAAVGRGACIKIGQR